MYPGLGAVVSCQVSRAMPVQGGLAGSSLLFYMTYNSITVGRACLCVQQGEATREIFLKLLGLVEV